MRKVASLLFVVFMLGITLPAFASPFSDLPADHWATNAVKVLAEKGLVEGYPDGTYKGDRASTRYEVAMIVARLVAYLEKQKPQVTKEDLDAVRRLVEEYKDELDAMGVRLKNVEDTLAALEGRVKKLEMVTWSGGFETRFVSASVKPYSDTLANAGFLTPFRFDGLTEGSRLPLGDQNALWDHVSTYNPDRNQPKDVEGYPMDRLYTVVPTESGTSLTQVGYLKVAAKLSDDYTAGGVVGMYNNQGDLGNGYTYGVTPPTLDNPYYNANNSFSAITNNLNVNLEQIFVVAQKQSLTAVVGDWRPAYIPDFILQGTPNPGVYGPDYLPFYGGQIYGQLAGNVAQGLYYEGFAGKLPAGANTAPWQNELFGGALRYDFKNPDITLTGGVVRVLNDSASRPPGAGALTGLGVDNPPGWCVVNPATGLCTIGIGPQQETLYGLEAKVHFTDEFKWLTVWGKFGNSQYNGNHADMNYQTVGGNLYNAGIWVDNGGELKGGADWLYVQPQYDPFISELNVPIAAFTAPTQYPGLGGGIPFYSFPYPVSYSPLFTSVIGFGGLTNGSGDVFYNVHDVRQYPANRTGLRAYVDWNYGRGTVGGKYEYLKQARTAFLSWETQPGFYEPIFFNIPGNPSSSDPGRGSITTWNFHADYTVPSKELTLSGIYISSRILRSEPRNGDFNNIDLNLNWWRVGADYRPAGNDLWDILAGYDQAQSYGAGRYLDPVLSLGGLAVMPNFLFKQKGGYFGVNYHFTNNATAWIMFNMYNLDDNTNRGSIIRGTTVPSTVSGFEGHQLSSGLRFIF